MVVEPVQHGFTATFFDANVSASGDTQEEAVTNLKSLLVDLFDDLNAEPAERLDVGPTRQLHVLRSLITRPR